MLRATPVLVVLAACSGPKEPVEPPVVDDDCPYECVPETEQRPGDPEAGYWAMVNEDYVTCGIPRSVFDMAFPAANAYNSVPGREGANETLPYNFSSHTNDDGVEVVAANCLQCHAGYLNGELVVGLGNSFGDYTYPMGDQAALVGQLTSDPGERAAWREWNDRVQAISPYLVTDTVGVNPADNLAAILMSHRDPVTLEWSNDLLMEPPPEDPVPLDTPPWWWMSKKNAQFWGAAGRGDHTKHQIMASTLCTNEVAEAEEIWTYFDDVRAWIASVEPPPYPEAVDSALAAEGEGLFVERCSVCHGTYGHDGVYPNVVVPIEEIGTDPMLAQSGFLSERFVDWFEASYYGEDADIVVQQAYIAPPLDGVWATGPYFHNGSVPTVRAVLDSDARPAFWQRSMRNDDLSYTDLGWNHIVHDEGKDSFSASQRKYVYDTTLPGYANTGHTYGDALTDEQRDALIEYLKTL